MRNANIKFEGGTPKIITKDFKGKKTLDSLDNWTIYGQVKHGIFDIPIRNLPYIELIFEKTPNDGKSHHITILGSKDKVDDIYLDGNRITAPKEIIGYTVYEGKPSEEEIRKITERL